MTPGTAPTAKPRDIVPWNEHAEACLSGRADLPLTSPKPPLVAWNPGTSVPLLLVLVYVAPLHDLCGSEWKAHGPLRGHRSQAVPGAGSGAWLVQGRGRADSPFEKPRGHRSIRPVSAVVTASHPQEPHASRPVRLHGETDLRAGMSDALPGLWSWWLAAGLAGAGVWLLTRGRVVWRPWGRTADSDPRRNHDGSVAFVPTEVASEEEGRHDRSKVSTLCPTAWGRWDPDRGRRPAELDRAGGVPSASEEGPSWVERRAAEVELRREAAVRDAILEQASDGIVISDVHGRIRFVNSAYERMTGRSRQEMLGKAPHFLESGGRDTAAHADLTAALRRGETWKGRLVDRRKDGHTFEQETTISPVRDAEGGGVSYFEITREINREGQLETQLRHAQKMVAIGQLAGGVVHDFNNLLSVIILQLELVDLVRGRPNEVSDAVREIRGATERAVALTRQLLVLSRRQGMTPRVFDLNEVVGNLGRMLERIIGADIQVRFTLRKAPTGIRGDVGMLEQVLMNLVVNARDAMPNGGSLLIETQAVEARTGEDGVPTDATSGTYARLRVGDTGCGMAPEVLSRIFEPFFTTKAAGQGTGLGLATAFGIVRQHQGWIAVESTPGRGSRFDVFLPLVKETPEAKASRAAKPLPWGAGEVILIVENDPNVRGVTTRVLERHGYRVLAAPDGATAIASWPEWRRSVRVLLTDVVMPGGLTGHRLARALRETKPDLKVVLTSGCDAERSGCVSESDSQDILLRKPMSLEQLLQAVKSAVAESPQRTP